MLTHLNATKPNQASDQKFNHSLTKKVFFQLSKGLSDFQTNEVVSTSDFAC